jgi:hypothetical protein
MKGFIFVSVFVLFGLPFVQAAEEEPGWKFWGDLRTGLRAETFGGGDDWNGPIYEWKEGNYGGVPNGVWQWHKLDDREPYDPSISMWSWFMGNYIDVSARYSQRNYGLKTSIWFNFFRDNPLDLYSAYVWADFLDDTIRMSFGRMKHSQDKIWIAPGAWDADYNYSTGDGLRMEFKPVDGLNVGFLLSVPDINEFWTSKDKNPISEKYDNVYKDTTNPSGWMGDGKNAKLIDFLLNTGFGAKYEYDLFDIAAGLKLNSRADGLTDSEWGETYFAFALWQLYGGPDGVNSAGNLLDGLFSGYNTILPYLSYRGNEDTFNLMGGGMQAYVGFNLKIFGPLSFKAGGRFYNLGAFNEFGWIWLNQEIKYTKGLQTFGVDLHQRIFAMDNDKRTFALAYTDETHTELLDKKPVLFTFIPRWSAILTRNWFATLETPVKLWPNIVNFDVTVNPKIGYSFGESIMGKTLIIELSYLFNAIVFSKNSHGFSDNTDSSGAAIAPFRDSDPLIRNTVQINFQLVF